MNNISLTNDELESDIYGMGPPQYGMATLSDMPHHGHMQSVYPPSHRVGVFGHQGAHDDDGDHAGSIGSIDGDKAVGGPQWLHAVNAVNAVPSSEILQFLAQETRLFRDHLESACVMYQESNKLPDSLFGVKKIRALQKKSGKKATAGMGRRPTTFNMFIKKRIEEIKAAEPNKDHKYTEIFKEVVSEWSALTTEEKKELGRQLHSSTDEVEEDAPEKYAGSTGNNKQKPWHGSSKKKKTG
jgi:hypothetical protein